jgi:DNA ligase (NAD+)
MLEENVNIKGQMIRLTNELKEHNYLYYVLADPIISDREFDRKLVELEQLEELHPEFKDVSSPTSVVGGGITKDFNTVKHDVPMLSLGNTYSKEELVEFDQRVVKSIGHSIEYSCELKFDGFAIGLKYHNGKLVQALTRGDGVQGDDVTTNVKTIRSIPLHLIGTYPKDFEVRGEIFMHRKAFERMNENRVANGENPFANPRNSAAGTIKMQEQSEVAKRPLDAFLYHVIGQEREFQTHLSSLQQTSKWGLPVSEYSQVANNMDEVWAYIEHWDKERKNLSFDIDGVVIKVNEYALQDELGYTAKSPRWAIAYKFETEQAATKLLSISYQVGRTGAITPVANLVPISLLGTTIKRASLHNADIIAQLDVQIGDTVFIEKGGEIIPKIVGVDLKSRPKNAKPVAFITHCLECQTELIRYEGEAAHYCPNENGCPPQIKGRIEHFISRKALNIDSLGEGKIGMLFDNGLVHNPADLFDLTYDDLFGLSKEIKNEESGEIRTISFRERTAEKVVEGIEKAKSIPFDQVLYGLGIRFVGATVAKKLATHFGNIKKLMDATLEELIAVDEIGIKIAQSVVSHFKEEQNKLIIQRLADSGLQLKQSAGDSPISDILLGKKIVVSGVFTNFSRAEIKTLIESHGGKNVSSISTKTDYIVAGENMGPAKLEKAAKLDIPIISESTFIDMVNV